MGTETNIRLLYSPWGQVEHQWEIAPGFIGVSTKSHGGLYLDAERNSEIPEDIRARTWAGQGMAGWYEEDVDWTIPAMLFAREFQGYCRDHGLNNPPKVIAGILDHFKPGVRERLFRLALAREARLLQERASASPGPRPGDAAAILAAEEGIDYARALVMTNTD